MSLTQKKNCPSEKIGCSRIPVPIGPINSPGERDPCRHVVHWFLNRWLVVFFVTSNDQGMKRSVILAHLLNGNTHSLVFLGDVNTVPAVLEEGKIHRFLPLWKCLE